MSIMLDKLPLMMVLLQKCQPKRRAAARSREWSVDVRVVVGEIMSFLVVRIESDAPHQGPHELDQHDGASAKSKHSAMAASRIELFPGGIELILLTERDRIRPDSASQELSVEELICRDEAVWIAMFGVVLILGSDRGIRHIGQVQCLMGSCEEFSGLPWASGKKTCAEVQLPGFDRTRVAKKATVWTVARSVAWW